MTHPWIVVAAVIAIAVLYVVLPVVAGAYRRFRRSRALRCPETGTQAEVGIDASRFALTSAIGRPLLSVKNCSLWPEKAGCRQDCLALPEVEMAEPLRLQAR